jgi:hypothetical protein
LINLVFWQKSSLDCEEYWLKNQGDEPQEWVRKFVGVRLQAIRAKASIAGCGCCLIECDPYALAGCEIQLKNFDFWGTIGGTQRSDEPESTEKSQLGSGPIASY